MPTAEPPFKAESSPQDKFFRQRRKGHSAPRAFTEADSRGGTWAHSHLPHGPTALGDGWSEVGRHRVHHRLRGGWVVWGGRAWRRLWLLLSLLLCPTGYHAIATIPKAKQSHHVAVLQSRDRLLPSSGTNSPASLGSIIQEDVTLTLPFPTAQDGVCIGPRD